MLRVRAEVVTAADRKDSAIDFAVEGDDVLSRDLMDLSLGSEEKNKTSVRELANRADASGSFFSFAASARWSREMPEPHYYLGQGLQNS
ncbi:uncharacterized protein LOC120706778 isoform X2 [Panicum virgatum]|uniref:uncharacterized protein LOC120706778 isoform X2 n=1 Tax=Panicum virgatum TaxID=38727 RepID=UPI0019D5326B|nr:uncharacterized protein LOC120706778 isoform X2 [Panicum virgatum]